MLESIVVVTSGELAPLFLLSPAQATDMLTSFDVLE